MDIDHREGRAKPWIARWQEPGGRQRSKGFRLRKEAAAHLAEIRHSLNRGAYIDPDAASVTLREFATAWLAASTADAPSREAIARRWRTHILPALGERPLGSIRPSVLQAFAAGLARQGLSPRYVAAIAGTLCSCLSAAVADHLIAATPCAALRLPRVPRTRVEPWESAQVAAVRKALDAHLRATVDTGAGLGLRQGEVFGLAVDDVDFLGRRRDTGPVVHVRRQVRLQQGKYLVFALPKGRKERDVPLPSSTSLRLAAHIREFPPVMVTLPWEEPDGRPVTARLIFTSSRGSAIRKLTYNRRWRIALKAAGFTPGPGAGFHALRHHYASVLLHDGVDVRSLAEYLGHADAGFTLRTYTHMLRAAPQRTRDAVDRAAGESAQKLRKEPG